MTNLDLDAQRKELRRRKRRKKQQQKRMIQLAILFVLLIVLIFLGKGIIGQVSAHRKAVEVAAQKEQAKKDAEAEKKRQEKEAAAAKKAEEEALAADPRRAFALDPAVPAGSDVQTEEKIVYLTFDDGPSANTESILNTLDQYNAKATFFVTALNPDYKGLIKEEYKRGHTIGLHTYSHDYGYLYSSPDAYFTDLEQVGEYVKEEIGYVPCFIRFPGGSSNSVSANYCQGIMSQLTSEVITRGYQYYDWNSDCGDASASNVPTDTIIQRACNDVPTNIVMLLHDASGKETTAEALPAIIQSYQSQGYTFKALDRESFYCHHEVNN